MKSSSPSRASLLLKLLLHPGAVGFGNAPKAKTVVYGGANAPEITILLKDKADMVVTSVTAALTFTPQDVLFTTSKFHSCPEWHQMD